jgi:hypothetical protein
MDGSDLRERVFMRVKRELVQPRGEGMRERFEGERELGKIKSHGDDFFLAPFTLWCKVMNLWQCINKLKSIYGSFGP